MCITFKLQLETPVVVPGCFLEPYKIMSMNCYANFS